MVLEEYPVELAIFEDKLNAVQAKIDNSDTVTRDAKVLLKSTHLHLGVSQRAWRMISCMDPSLEVELESEMVTGVSRQVYAFRPCRSICFRR